MGKDKISEFRVFVLDNFGVRVDEDIESYKEHYSGEDRGWVYTCCCQWMELTSIIDGIDAQDKTFYYNNTSIQAILEQTRNLIMRALMTEADRRRDEKNG